jgi:hypothetical protein
MEPAYLGTPSSQFSPSLFIVQASFSPAGTSPYATALDANSTHARVVHVVLLFSSYIFVVLLFTCISAVLYAGHLIREIERDKPSMIIF